MLHTPELFTLARDLAHRKVLTLYVDNRVTDPARREAWRAALANELRIARNEIGDAEERAAFDRAAALLHEPIPPPGGMWAAPGWVAFATPDERILVRELPRRVKTRVAWRDGPMIVPLLRALANESVVIVALLRSREARLFRYAHGGLEMLDELRLSSGEAASASVRSARVRRAGRGYPAPRSAPETDSMQRQHGAELRRLARALAARVTLLANDDAILLVSGAPEWRRLAMEALPPRLRVRAVVSGELEANAPASAIVRAAKRARRDVQSRRGRELVSRTLGRVGHRAVAGIPALQRALRLKAVDLLLASPHFLELEDDWAERLLQAALAQGARVEVVTGDAGALLDHLGDGVAARLRFAIDPSPKTPDHLVVA